MMRRLRAWVMSSRVFTLAFLVAAASCAPAAAADFEVAQVIGPARVALPPGRPQPVAIEVAVRPGYHVQANPAAYPNLIPITLSLTPTPGVAVGAAIYPDPPKRLRLEGSGDQLLVYDGRLRIVVPIARYAAHAAPIRLQGSLRYQGCDHRHCLFPQTVPLVLTVDAAGP